MERDGLNLIVVSAVIAGVGAAQGDGHSRVPAACAGLPLRQDVFAEGGILLGARGCATLVGYLGHAALAAAIACVYAGFFHLVGEDHLLVWGAFGGVLHFAIGGAVVGAVFPVVDAVVDAKHPGLASRRYGRRDVTTFLAGHLAFGSLLGVLYPTLGLYAAW